MLSDTLLYYRKAREYLKLIGVYHDRRMETKN
jgi:hypothetical protein